MRKIAKRAFVLIAAVVFISPPLLHIFMGIGISPILSNSMKPFASAGDIFITKGISASALQVGDIVNLNSKEVGGQYAHRIISINSINGTIEIHTKGDGNPTAEREPVIASPSQVLQKEIGVLPWVGKPLVYLSSHSGRQISIAFLIAANILGLFAFAFRERKVILSTARNVYRDLYNDERERKVFADKSGGVYKSLYEDERGKREALERRLAGKRSYIFAEDSNSEVNKMQRELI